MLGLPRARCLFNLHSEIRWISRGFLLGGHFFMYFVAGQGNWTGNVPRENACNERCLVKTDNCIHLTDRNWYAFRENVIPDTVQ